MAVAPHEAEGETEEIDFPDIPLVQPQLIEAFEEFLAGIGRAIIEPLQLFSFPLILFLPGGVEDHLIHPRTDGEPRQVIVRLGEQVALQAVVAL